MNARIRKGGLSAREIWTQRDQVTGQQLPIDDRELIIHQHLSRLQNHQFSAQSKAPGKHASFPSDISVGDLVFITSDRDKTKCREKYLVVSMDGSLCQLRKFTKSQFRSKTYDVNICDCYPVSQNTLGGSKQGPVRGIDDSTSESESDDDSACDPQCVRPPSPLVTLPAPPDDPPVVPERVTPPDVHHDQPDPAPHLVHDDLAQPDTRRRSQRPKSAPSWQKSEDWVM